jgi:phosphoribosylaminoimidazolecarboxamide formyltransferase/IMP cyclohydrolase
MNVKRALLSVSDKSGIVDLARELNGLGIKIISSGGTAKAIKAGGMPCTEISEVTGFPEILDGRVKTLNPKIHGGILAVRSDKGHMNELSKYGIEQIDIVVVNLYPFEETGGKYISNRRGDIPQEVVEDIDIGGVALLRAAAKNFADVLVVSDPKDYPVLIEKLRSGVIDASYRRELAAKAFRHTAYYDGLISSYFTLEKFPEQLSIPLKKLSSLRYGENPHQQATVYFDPFAKNYPGVINSKQLQGKELSYNNYQDLESAWNLANEFDTPACAIIKHANPCGCALGENLLDAYQKALACDPVSAYGGIIAVNREIDDKLAAEIAKLFTECIIAPSYSEKAKKIFSEKKNLRLLEQPLKAGAASQVLLETKSMTGGMLVQDRDLLLSNETKVSTKKSPTSAEIVSLNFAWKVSKHVKSNAVVLARGTQTVGVGAGQMSRIDSLKIASSKMSEMKYTFAKELPLVLASDAYFPFADVVNESSKIKVTAIIQPGGSIRDEDSIKAADTHNISMVFTGIRHFRH